MPNNGWVKFYRKITENGILKDHTAWAVFSWLLLMVDRETGKRTIGRFQMSDELGIKPNTLYKVLHRLEKKWGVISLLGQKTHTEVLVVNWAKYQQQQEDQSNDSQMIVKSSSLASNTKQEYKNKELRIDDVQEKIPNRLILSKGQLIAYAKEFTGLTTQEISEQRIKCNAYMNMSSETYANPGLFFKKWLTRYKAEKNVVVSKERLQDHIINDLPVISEEERQRNLIKLAEIKKNLKERLVVKS